MLVSVLLLLCATHALAATVTLNANTNWSAIITGSGAGGQPSSADNIIVTRGATLTVDVANGQAASIQLGLDSGAPGQRGNGTLLFNAGSQVTVAGIVTLGDNTSGGARQGSIDMSSGGRLVLAGFAVNVLGAWTPGTGTVELTATNTLPSTAGIGTFNNLVITAGTTTLGQNTTVSGNIVVNGTLAGTNTVTLNGTNTSIDGTGSVTASGTWSISTGAKSIPSTANLSFSAATFAISGAITVTNNGTITTTAAGGITGTVAGSTWTNAANSTLSISGPLLATGTLNASANSNTVNYGGGAQTVKVPSAGYHHLTLSGSGTKTAGGSFTVGGNLAITGVTFAGGTTVQTVNGNVSNTGTHTASTGSITLNGGAAAHVLSGTGTYANLVMNDANGASLSANPTVSGTLTLTNGVITTGSNAMITTANCTAPSISRTGGHVAGFLRMAIPVGAPNCTFHVGDSATYRPITVAFASVTGAGNFTGSVSQSAGDHPNIATSGLDSGKSVNRYWTLTNGGVTFTTYSITLTFVAGDVDGGANTANFEIVRWDGTAWNTTTVGTRTGTSTQASGIGGVGDFAVAEKLPAFTAPGDFNAFESSTTPNPGAITGRIYTKLVGTNFSLDVVAILSGAQHATFTNTVQVDLVTGSTGGLNCPGTPATITGTTQNVNLTNGRGTTGSFNVANAYRDVRVRIRYPVASPTVTSCSTDNFSIRPLAFSAPTSNMTNSGTSGTPVAKAGDAFTITTMAGAGYDGTPAIDTTKITPHTGAIQTGVVGGAFGAANPATGTATGASFTYSEAGNFLIEVNGVFDGSFTSVDPSGTDCTKDFSNSLVGGQYGCRFGNSAASSAIGRFTPDHFDVLLNTPVFSPACTGFTYVGQAFNYSTAPVITVTARNSAALGNAITKNYTGAWQKITNATLTYPGGTNRGYRSLAGTLDVTGVPGTDPAIAAGGAGSEGTVTLAFSSGTGLFFQRGVPVSPFDAELSLAINVIDADSIVFAANPAKFGNEVAGGGIMFSDLNPATTNDKSVRFGRLQLANASGSQLLPLAMPMETQYWNGTAFITNTADDCTTVASANVGLGNFTGITSADTSPSVAGGPFSAGRKTLTLSAPGAGKSGSVDVVVNLNTPAGAINSCVTFGPPAPTPSGANLAHLRGKWCGASYDRDSTARARFGVFKGAEEVIFIRENF